YIGHRPTIIDLQIATDLPSELFQPLLQRGHAGLRFRIGQGAAHQYADPPHPAGLLRARHSRPCRRDAAQRDELAPPHSIASSAMASRPGGKLSPNALAVLRLITNSNLVDCRTGRSAGFWPLIMRPT